MKALERMHQEGIKTYVMIAPLLPGAEVLVSELEGIYNVERCPWNPAQALT